MKNATRLLFLCLAVAMAMPAQDVDREGRPISPFRGMREVAAGIEVQLADDTWWSLQSVAGVDAATLQREAVRLCGDRAWKRLTEDLPAVLAAMGVTVGDAVDLVVQDVATGERRELPAVPMTKDNRERLRAANRGAERPAGLPAPRAAKATLTAQDVRDDLAELRRLLDGQFAYRELRRVDLDALLRDAAKELGTGPVAAADFTRVVDRVLRAFGDGHSRLDGPPAAAAVFPPFLVQQVEGGHVAFRPDRRGFVDPERPFLVAIDGVPIATWLDAATRRATRGSAVMQAREAERGLRDLALLRGELPLPLPPRVEASPRLTITLRGAAGERTQALDFTTARPTYGAWPRTATRRLEGDLGYLRIESMQDDAAFLDGLDAAMQSFRDTRGLVIDVRGNGGGTRDALRRLAPYFLPADGAPVVGNVAAVLLERGRAAAPDALADRGLYPLDWSGWSDAQRAAIRTFVRTWKPSWKLPAGKFSPWHFLMLDRADNAGAFAYAQKVVVLIDRACFSATDVFAAGLGALPNVTLVGEATSGGSGRARGHVLPASGLRLQLSTMASFRPDGVLFEGNGVVPDVEQATAPGDLIGASDTVLARAVALLR